MIRTAILAGILLVMLSMAYSRPSALPSLSRDAAPEQDVALQEESAPLHEAPVHPAPVMQAPAPSVPPAVAKAEEPDPEAVLVAAPMASEAPPAEPEVAALPQPAAPSAPAPIVAEPGRPISLLPPSMTASTPAREPGPVAPLVTEDKTAPLPEVHVPTRPVMVPTDLASRLLGPGVTPEPTDPAVDARLRAAAAPQFMTPQERSRELYRLAREMEDTFIQQMTQ